MNLDPLVAPGYTGNDTNTGFGHLEGSGKKADQMRVGFTIHRWRSKPQLDLVTQFFSKTVTGCAWLDPDIEHQIIVLPLVKNGHTTL